MSKNQPMKSIHKKNKETLNKELYASVKDEEKKKKKERLTYLETLSEKLSLPQDMLTGGPIVTMNGRNSVCIENHKKVLEYTENRVKILTKLCTVTIEGSRLKISFCTKDEAKITGIIDGVYYKREEK